MCHASSNRGRCSYRSADINLQRGVKYFVNVGSVGQPRVRYGRTTCSICDVQALAISIRRLEFDIETDRSKIWVAGLPPSLGTGGF